MSIGLDQRHRKFLSRIEFSRDFYRCNSVFVWACWCWFRWMSKASSYIPHWFIRRVTTLWWQLTMAPLKINFLLLRCITCLNRTGGSCLNWAHGLGKNGEVLLGCAFLFFYASFASGKLRYSLLAFIMKYWALFKTFLLVCFLKVKINRSLESGHRS